MKAASRNGIYVVNVPDFCGEEVSNHVIMFILAYAKKLTTMDNLLKNGRWQQAKMVTEPMRSIHGETLGIIGCGNLGRWVAQKAKAFNMRIVGYDKYTQRDVIEKAGIEFVSLDELLQMSDYITLNVTYTEETHHMINKAALAKMKSNCVLINCSRGSVVDEVALIEALRSGVIEGACLDVFESEPIESHNPLLKMERVLLTPHNASYSDVSFVRLKQSVIQEALRIKDGLLPKNLVNKSLGKPND
jgi:phosphoglycerate dehydrogenase-like enzyme